MVQPQKLISLIGVWLLTYDYPCLVSEKCAASFFTSGLKMKITYSSETLPTTHETVLFITPKTTALNAQLMRTSDLI
jgi:hypothetical protein